MNHTARLDALRSRLEAPLLVSRPANLRYVTGFTGSNGWMLVRPDGPATFITDGRYGEMAASLVDRLDDADLVVYTSGMWEAIKGVVGSLDGVTLEADHVTWAFATDFHRETGVEVVPGGGAVEGLRRAKDPAEVGALASAAAAGDAAFAALGSLAASDLAEVELGWRLIDEMRRHGGEAANWEPIVAAGPGASIPHYRSGRNPVGSGLLLLDYGCVVDGYHSDMSRTVWLDGRPDDEMVRVHRAVREAQEAGIAAVAPGVPCSEVDEAARSVLRSYGYEEHFLHSTGHGVGLEIHEAPWLRRGNDDPLAPGDVVTVEPGVYLPGVGVVRIEDMVAVTADGAEVLTASPKEMVAA
jgi:Xaa-Pro aminopeptidase